MLSHLLISNYTIVDSLELEFSSGMTVITGETGAGKSIMIDALGLCLGDRADPAAVRSGCPRAEITATFDIAEIPAAQRWLEQRELDANGECILRRVITREGRSRAFINGNSTTLQECGELGEMLIDIHSQHAHQSLLRRDHQRELLDAYAQQSENARDLARLAGDWARVHRELDALVTARDEQGARAQLLAYQVEELDQLSLQADELEALEAEQKQLANADRILESTQQALELCDEHGDGARRALHLLQEDALSGKALDEARELLDSAAIQIEEATHSLRTHLDNVEIDPGRLAEVERRLDSIYDIARKHRVQPEGLAALHESLAEELAGLSGQDARVESLQAELDEICSRYDKLAQQVSKARRKAAKKLEAGVQAQLAELAMAQCTVEIALLPLKGDAPHGHGLEDVELRVSTNPGQSPRPLARVASGGELSRISLAIEVICADAGTVPAMVFDEVDVGIGGAVAEVVGRLLRGISARAQVLCVTHLPQVAAQGHEHLQVIKATGAEENLARLTRLSSKQRVEEIARMLGGIDITDKTRAAAREMLTRAD